MLTNKPATSQEYQLILEIWEQSVRATHDFLTMADIEFYKEQIPQFLGNVDVRIWLEGEQPIGFSGTSGQDLDMLFLDPTFIGGGYGHKILTWLMAHQQIKAIDVNEQNETAKGFYLSHGFKVVSRSQTDGFGKPYPILHSGIE